MGIGITSFNAICNLGWGINEIYSNAIVGNNNFFEIKTDIINNKKVRLGTIKQDLPEIQNPIYNTRCNQMVLSGLQLLDKEINELVNKYDQEEIAVVVATTNTGVEEYEQTKNPNHFELGNPALFVKEYLQLKNLAISVSTACSSGIKAFSIARDILKEEFAKSVLVIGVDSIAKLPIFGFNSLEVLSQKPTNPFSENRDGINIGEGIAIFILENNEEPEIEILGLGETTDIYHSTSPDPAAKESIKAIQLAMEEAKLSPKEVDYVNLHGTGTISNDTMEANAINFIFGENIPCSSTKPLTGHCLGAAAAIETALCCKLIKKRKTKLYPHIYNGKYDSNLPKIKLISEKNNPLCDVKTCLCTAFGFGGTNAAIILGGKRNG